MRTREIHKPPLGVYPSGNACLFQISLVSSPILNGEGLLEPAPLLPVHFWFTREDGWRYSEGRDLKNVIQVWKCLF